MSKIFIKEKPSGGLIATVGGPLPPGFIEKDYSELSNVNWDKARIRPDGTIWEDSGIETESEFRERTKSEAFKKLKNSGFTSDEIRVLFGQ